MTMATELVYYAVDLHSRFVIADEGFMEWYEFLHPVHTHVEPTRELVNTENTEHRKHRTTE